jgi:class 3 adenylate cyclase
MAIKCGRGYGAFQQPRGGNLASDRVQRRLTAILAADVAGYSRLMGLDEAGTARTLHEHRAAVDPIVAHHGGRIVKTTGDGVLLEFPSIVAAVDCAVVVQNLMRERNRDVPEELRMLFRIGINLGDVLIDGDDILGDGGISRRGSKASRSPAVSACPMTFTGRFQASSTSLSKTSGTSS